MGHVFSRLFGHQHHAVGDVNGVGASGTTSISSGSDGGLDVSKVRNIADGGFARVSLVKRNRTGELVVLKVCKESKR
jgi:hypothetical protein